MRVTDGIGNRRLVFGRIPSWGACLVCACALSTAVISCGKQENSREKNPVSNSSSTQQKMDVSVPSGMMKAMPGNDSIPAIVESQTSHDEGLRLAFSGMKTEGGNLHFKVYDWESSQETWVSKGEDYRGYKVVGLDPSGKDVLILEKNEYWFIYPLERLQLDSGSRGEKPKVLMAADVPEGVSIMDYIAANTEPLNPPDMPADLNPGPVVDMDALIAGQAPVNTKPDEM